MRITKQEIMTDENYISPHTAPIQESNSFRTRPNFVMTILYNFNTIGLCSIK